MDTVEELQENPAAGQEDIQTASNTNLRLDSDSSRK